MLGGHRDLFTNQTRSSFPMNATTRDPRPRRHGSGMRPAGHLSLKQLAVALALSTAVVTTLGAAPAWAFDTSQSGTAVTTQQARPASFADLAKRLKPAVVYVEAIHKLSENAKAESEFGFPPFANNPQLRQFFRRFFGPDANGTFKWRTPPKSGARIAAGSGFFIDASGYIVTNNHVIDDADKIIVRTNDGKRYVAKLVGRDTKTDLALLKISDNHDFPYVSWGNSDDTHVGDWILAIGNPFGLGGTVTAGIVSARGRDIRSGPYDDFLQIDAPINAGNSGGPLFDMNGQVVGINTAIYTPNGGNVGIGFAIPSKIAKTVIAQLREHGSVVRGWLGVEVQPVTPDIAKSLGLAEAQGSIVVRVIPHSPASTAGLKQGDVILTFDGKPIKKSHDLPVFVGSATPGHRYQATIWRHGRTIDRSVVLAKQAATKMAAARSGKTLGHTAVSGLGLTVAPLTRDTRAAYGIPASVKGVLVVDVSPDGPALEGGIRPGDVIVAVNETPVASPADVRRQLTSVRASKHHAALFLINRNGDQLYVGLSIPTA
jgi:serine protease Do